MLKANALVKKYNKGSVGEVTAVNGVSLELPDKGMVAILGKSGSGKTTLLHLLGGMDRPDSGSIEIEGNTFSAYDAAKWDKQRSEKIGYVFQNYCLLGDVSVYRNLELALNLAGLFDKAEIDRRIGYALSLVGMEKYKKRLPGTLSGGQQQRVGIARAIVKRPQMIIADEPTGNLDDRNTMAVMEILKNISSECLVLLVTHEQNLADFYADRILLYSDGRIVDEREGGAGAGLEHKTADVIYLGDMQEQKTKIEEKLLIDFFSEGNCPAIRLTVAVIGGKVFIRPEEGTSLKYSLISAIDRIKLLPGKYEKMTSHTDSAAVYDPEKLPKIANHGKHVFKLGGIIKSSIFGFMSGERHCRAYYIMPIAAILIALIVSYLGRLFIFDPVYYGYTDEHIVKISAQSITEEQRAGLLGAGGEKILEVDYDNRMQIIFPDLEPYTNSNSLYGDMSALPMPLGYLDKEDIIAGTGDIKDGEIVMPLFMAKSYSSEYFGITDYKQLIGLYVSSDSSDIFMIAGITDGGSYGVYYTDNDYAGLEKSTSTVNVYTNDKAAVIAYAKNAGLSAVDMSEAYREEFLSNARENSTGYLIALAILFGIAFIGSARIGKTTAVERVKEIGQLRIIGISKTELLRLHAAEGITLSLASGGLCFLILATAIRLICAKYAGVANVIYLPLWLAVTVGAALVLFTAFGSALFIFRLLKKTPAEFMAQYDL